MDLHVDFEFHDELLLATARGAFTFDAALNLLMQILDNANEKGVTKVLIDCLAMTGELSMLERYDLGARIASYSLRQISRKVLAIVGVPPTINGFAVRVAENRGLVTAVFGNKRDAMAWLAAFPTRMTEPEE